MKRGAIRIGISGWTYTPWRGVFYPEDLKQKNELEYASRQFSSIEINGTFYSLQKPGSFASWARRTPDDFVFSVKATRYITHIKRLKDARIPMANFFASGILALGHKLGPILWQVPPSLRFDTQVLEDFLSLLPHDTAAASRLARKHEARMKGRALITPAEDMPIRHALEIRHKSFETPGFIEMLRRHKVAAVVADTVSWPCLSDVTADFMYLRLHGSEELYVSGYDDESLDRWATRIRAWTRGGAPRDMKPVVPAGPGKTPRDIYVYFDNDAKVRAPADARSLARRLGVEYAPEGSRREP